MTRPCLCDGAGIFFARLSCSLPPVPTRLQYSSRPSGIKQVPIRDLKM